MRARVKMLILLSFSVLIMVASVTGASASTVPPTIAPHVSAISNVQMSPDVTEWCISTGNSPFTLTKGSYTLRAQTWITSCSVPPPSECRIAVYIWENGPYGWYQTPGINDGTWGLCKLNSRIEATYACSPTSTTHQFQTEITITSLSGTPGATFIVPTTSFKCD